MTPTSHGRSGRPWRRLREQVLREEPWCQIRGPKCTGTSTTVDHAVPLSVAPHLAHVRSNLRGACAACNYRGGARITNGYRAASQAARTPRRYHNPLFCTKDTPLGCTCQLDAGTRG